MSQHSTTQVQPSPSSSGALGEIRTLDRRFRRTTRTFPRSQRQLPLPLTSLQSRFLSKVDTSDSCWLWTGTQNGRGYGQLSAGRNGGSPRRAHRVSYELFVAPIPDGLEVCHRCDNPPCVNPDHLFLGTHRDNMADSAKKGRATGAAGERNRHARLTASDILAICRLHGNGVGQRELARRYRIASGHINSIVHRRSWSHVK